MYVFVSSNNDNPCCFLQTDRAARTSVEQLRIALQLGDPVLVARCKLYIALSLAQYGRLRQAAQIVRYDHFCLYYTIICFSFND